MFGADGRTLIDSASCEVLRAVKIHMGAVCCMTPCSVVGTGACVGDRVVRPPRATESSGRLNEHYQMEKFLFELCRF